MRREIVLGMAALGLLAGCGEETFEAAPDCSGRFAAAFVRQPALDQADAFLYDFEALGFHALPGLNSATAMDLDPTMTQDLRFIAFERSGTATASDILIYDRCQASLLAQPGLNSPFADQDPAFSGDGLRLAFVRDTLGRREVRVYDGTRDQLVPLPGLQGAGLYTDADPVPNQDASLIAFASNRNGNHDVLVYDAGGDSLIDLPDLASAQSDVDPSLTPDGRYLMFASDRTNPGDYDLYLYDLQTRSFIALAAAVNTTASERHPSINYDAQNAVFESDRAGGMGATDLYLYSRSSGQVTNSGASSPGSDGQGWIVWR